MVARVNSLSHAVVVSSVHDPPSCSRRGRSSEASQTVDVELVGGAASRLLRGPETRRTAGSGSSLRSRPGMTWPRPAAVHVESSRPVAVRVSIGRRKLVGRCAEVQGGLGPGVQICRKIYRIIIVRQKLRCVSTPRRKLVGCRHAEVDPRSAAPNHFRHHAGGDVITSCDVIAWCDATTSCDVIAGSS